MSPDIYPLIYIGISLFVGWPVAARLLLGLFASDGGGVDNSDRFASAGIGLIACAFWPLLIVVLPMALLMRTRLFRTRPEREALEQEKHEAQRRELEQLRRKVREYEIKGGEHL